MFKIALFGGSFDPIHKGHLSLLEAAGKSDFFDKILILPSALSPFKSLSTVSFPSYRYEMVKIAMKSLNQDNLELFELSDLEFYRQEKSYTLKTVEELEKIYAHKAPVFYLICGADIPLDIEQWYKAETLLSKIGLFIAQRPGVEDADLKLKTDEIKEKYGSHIRFFDARQLNLSSGKLRETYLDNKDFFKESLPKGVYEFILENNLYDPKYSMEKYLTEENIKELLSYEKSLRKLLTAERLIHSLNTMREAMYLASLNDYDPFKAALAGLIHDCTKQCKECNEDFEKVFPSKVIHAHGGSMYAREVFGIEDEDILNSIKYHTTSRKNASLLEKIVFVADKIEASRNFPRIDELRNISYFDLNLGYYECLVDIVKALHKKGIKPIKDTKEALLDSKRFKKGEYIMAEIKLAERIKEILDDKKGLDIQIVDLEGKTIIADYFVIASGRSKPHIQSLADELESELKKEDIIPLSIEGRESARWVLLDYGATIVHIFHEEDRDFYSLEKLWQNRPPV